MHASSVLEAVLARDRTVVLAGLVIVVVLAWSYLLLGAGMGMTAFEITSMSVPGTSSTMERPGDGSGMAAQRGTACALERLAYESLDVSCGKVV